MHGVGAFADADREDGTDPGGPGAVEQGFAVFGVAGAVEMGVGVYEHLRLLLRYQQVVPSTEPPFLP